MDDDFGNARMDYLMSKAPNVYGSKAIESFRDARSQGMNDEQALALVIAGTAVGVEASVLVVLRDAGFYEAADHLARRWRAELRDTNGSET